MENIYVSNMPVNDMVVFTEDVIGSIFGSFKNDTVDNSIVIIPTKYVPYSSIKIVISNNEDSTYVSFFKEEGLCAGTKEVNRLYDVIIEDFKNYFKTCHKSYTLGCLK